MSGLDATTVDGDPTVIEGGAASAAPPDVGHVLGARYRLDRPLGQGGFGTVWRAWDSIDEIDVAIKVIPGLLPQQIDQIRREVAALRWASFPGVVTLRDDGIDGQHWFLVMDLVEGRPMGGRRMKVAWDVLRGPMVALVETLARLHGAGLVHGDIKPENIILSRDGKPTLLDFGLVKGIDAAGDGRFGGTPRYCAPEQVAHRGIDARSDLYSVGVLMFELLSGEHPQGRGCTVQEFMARKLMTDSPPLFGIAPQVPVTIALLVDDLLDRDPEGRPQDAGQVLLRMGVEIAQLGPGRFESAASAPMGVRSLFAGDDAFDHRAERCAAQLHERTAGVPSAASDEVAAWLRAGLAHVDKGLVHVGERELAQLESGLRVRPAKAAPELDGDAGRCLGWIRAGWPDVDRGVLVEVTGLAPARVDAALSDLRARGLVWDGEQGRLCAGAPVMSGEPPAVDWRVRLVLACKPSVARLRHVLALGAGDVAQEALVTAEALIAEGRLGGARSALELGLAATFDTEHRLELARRLAEEALAAEDAQELDRIATAISLRLRGTPEVAELEDLLRASRSALRGEKERAAEILARVPPLGDEALEIWRQGTRVLVASLEGPERELEFLESLSAWAQRGSALRRAKHQGWLGNYRYRQGEFDRAAELQRASLEGKERPTDLLSARTNLAAALLDGLRFEDAAVAARSARAYARTIGHRRFEAIAAFIGRAAAYRSDAAAEVRTDLVQAAASMGPYFKGLFALTEAGVGWRLGQTDEAFQLAHLSSTAFSRAGLSEQALLMRVLARVLGGEVLPVDDELVREARTCRPGIAIQALGLMRRVRPDLVRSEELAEVASFRPRSQWPVRLDTISIDEALQSGPSSTPDLPRRDSP